MLKNLPSIISQCITRSALVTMDLCVHIGLPAMNPGTGIEPLEMLKFLVIENVFR
jgi:hypothetical protein